MFQRLALAILLLTAAGCAPTQPQLLERAQRVALPQGLQQQLVATERFQVMSYARLYDQREPLRVYLEGDGRAWITRTRISLNPTPQDPVALRLAATDGSANVVYIARPCQYVDLVREPQCTPHYWSQGRYSTEIVQAINDVIDHYTARGAVSGVELVGYSGGGALAVLVAHRRNDVTGVRTVAGNLDTQLFTRLHQVSPLKDSLNPAIYAPDLQHLPQLHYVGSADEIIPAAIAVSYRQATGRDDCVGIRSVSGATHSDGWVERWPALLGEPLRCAR